MKKVEVSMRMWKTLVLLMSFLTIGMGLVIVGPTLLDLTQQTGESLTVVSGCLSARSAGYILGSCLMGYVYPKINFQLWSGIALLANAVLSIAVPFTGSIFSLLPVFVVTGVCQAFYETGGYIFATHMWGSDAAPAMQALAFMISTGALMGPLIARPFLSKTGLGSEYEMMETSRNETEVLIAEQDDLRLYYPYSILGCLLLLASALNFLLWSISPETPGPESKEGEIDTKSIPRSRGWTIFSVILILVFMFFYYGVDITLGSYLVAFSVTSELHLDKGTGALITTAYWTATMIPKLIAAALVKWTGNEVVIIVSLIVLLIGNVVLVPFGDKSEACLWTGVVIVGAGLSAIWGAMFGFVEELIGLSSSIGSFMIVAAMTGEFIFPFVISFMIESEPRILLWTVLVCAVSCALFFCVLMILKRTVLKVK